MMKKDKPTTDQRRAFVMSMRDSGLSYDQIAAEAIKTFGAENLPQGYNKRLACLDLKRELKKQSSTTLKADFRKNLILKYRMAGMTYHQIYEKLRVELRDDLPKDYTERNACRDLRRYLQKIDSINQHQLIEAKNLYRERLNFLLSILWEKASQGDFQSIDRVLIIIKTLSKIDGLENVTPSMASSTEKNFNSLAELGEYFNNLNGKGNGNGNNTE